MILSLVCKRFSSIAFGINPVALKQKSLSKNAMPGLAEAFCIMAGLLEKVVRLPCFHCTLLSE
jgi:hypothetical protein